MTDRRPTRDLDRRLTLVAVVALAVPLTGACTTSPQVPSGAEASHQTAAERTHASGPPGPSGEGSIVGSTTRPSITRGGEPTFPPPGSFVTSIVRVGLADPVPVPGEPHRTNDDPRIPEEGTVTLLPITVHIPSDWAQRQSLVLCGWTPADGFNGCVSVSGMGSAGQVTLQVPTRQPHDNYELWLLGSDTRVGLRRLLAIDTWEVPFPLTVQPARGFESINAVLTQQPPADGNYLVQPS